MANKAHNKTTKQQAKSRAWIEKRGKYSYLRWETGGKALYLGSIPQTPTGLLDVALSAAPKLTLFELRKLLSANKSMRF